MLQSTENRETSQPTYFEIERLKKAIIEVAAEYHEDIGDPCGPVPPMDSINNEGVCFQLYCLLPEAVRKGRALSQLAMSMCRAAFIGRVIERRQDLRDRGPVDFVPASERLRQARGTR